MLAKIKKNYRMGFDIGGLILFLALMAPNLIWFAVPAPNDILRVESVTGVLDMVASVFQVIMVAALCAVINKTRGKAMLRKPILYGIIVSCLLYYTGWFFYYNGMVSPLIILDLFITPCLAFLLFAVFRKNMIALVPTLIFTLCHSVYGVVNFIV